MKQGLTLSSWLDAMVKVNNDLRRRARAGERVAGYNVIRTQTGSPRMDKYSIIKIKYLILKYVEKYGVIFVCTPANSAGHINVPAFFSPKLPIISVGSVDIFGDASLFSPRGPAITVSAPGNSVECAKGTGRARSQRRTGTSVAAPAIAWLVAYFLYLTDVGPMLRQRLGSIPQAVKQYLTDMAYIRTDSRVKSIWNGLDGARGATP